ncbi:pimeloyl-ACP methyl ester carboxylesterase [Barrientosiimonas humi]|uniref:Pimeloyl-ACP methyl ester carboxylesterase n=1 Tax=Barrientosiimonas humi TaxID=999931 RepID=A0A542XE78_9MICO|nr:alpha/beta hydrolase [Barrientosiimonas humi]TQL34130.1 pimeloyl-ACP methyl ester carboxylesterase [Barrientosiimonas humi]CAG7574120.1 Arylesterase [Barrientosiimonas humi]
MSEVSVNSQMLGLKDVQVHVDDHGGPGRPVVLIHGWPLSGESWSEQIEPLQQAGLRVITYDRRGFGRSDKPSSGYDYDTFADDLAGVLEALDLRDVTLVGFSMGGGEVVRYLTRHGADRIRNVVLAAAVPPYLLQSEDNPDGPMTQDLADDMESQLKQGRSAFFDDFTTQFFAAGGEGEPLVTEQQRQDAIRMAEQSDQDAALGAMEAFGTTDFRDELPKITVPVLIVHGDADGIVPFEGSGQRSADAISGSEVVLVPGGPHGLNVSHAKEFNDALIDFLTRDPRGVTA